MQRVSIFMSPLRMTPDSQSFRFVCMSAFDDDLDLQGTEAEWLPQWCPRLAELCCTGTVMHALNMSLHLSKQVSSTFCEVMFASLVDNIQQFCKAMLACSVLLMVGPEQGHQICDCVSTLQMHVTFGSRSRKGKCMAVMQAALGYKYSVCSWAAGKPIGLVQNKLYRFSLMQKLRFLC